MINQVFLCKDIQFEIDFVSARMCDDLELNVFRLSDLIRTLMVKLNVYTDYQIDYDLFVNEIIAYLFLVFYGQKKDSNINKYQIEKDLEAANQVRYSDKEISVDGDADLGRIERNREREVYLRFGNEKYKEFVRRLGVDVPKSDSIRCIQQGRYYDRANMIMIDEQVNHDITTVDNRHRQKHTLFDLLLSKDICNSHSVTATEIAEAYSHLNETYAHARGTKDFQFYIDNWVNFYRLESRMSYSLINKIADYMLSNSLNEFPEDKALADIYWKPTIFVFPKQIRVTDSWSVLRYQSWIPEYFKISNERIMDTEARSIRILELMLLNLVSSVAKKAFKPYFENDTLALRYMYEFCKNDYPIIESHVPISLYLDGENKKLNHKKIKLIRKIFKVLTPPDEIKNYFGREKHKNSKKSV